MPRSARAYSHLWSPSPCGIRAWHAYSSGSGIQVLDYGMVGTYLLLTFLPTYTRLYCARCVHCPVPVSAPLLPQTLDGQARAFLRPWRGCPSAVGAVRKLLLGGKILRDHYLLSRPGSETRWQYGHANESPRKQPRRGGCLPATSFRASSSFSHCVTCDAGRACVCGSPGAQLGTWTLRWGSIRTVQTMRIQVETSGH